MQTLLEYTIRHLAKLKTCSNVPSKKPARKLGEYVNIQKATKLHAKQNTDKSEVQGVLT